MLMVTVRTNFRLRNVQAMGLVPRLEMQIVLHSLHGQVFGWHLTVSISMGISQRGVSRGFRHDTRFQGFS